MRDAIIEKLKGVVAEKDYSEQDIVYFFVESYKLLEQQNRLSDFPVIRFYRNWICHALITNDADRIFEELYVIIRAEKYMSFPEPEEGEPPGFLELVNSVYRKAFSKYFFPKLKAELDVFGARYLDRNVPHWQSFRAQLYNVLVDVPLIVKRKDEEVFRLSLEQLSDDAEFDHVRVAIKFPQGSQTTTTSDEYFLYESRAEDEESGSL